MSAPPDDRDLAAAFEALREQERGSAPDFHRMWNEARRRVERRAPRRWVPAASLAGAAAMVALAAFLLRPGAPSSSIDEAIVLAEQLDRWEAPSDVLLTMDNGGLDDSVPTLEFDFLNIPSPDLGDWGLGGGVP